VKKITNNETNGEVNGWKERYNRRTGKRRKECRIREDGKGKRGVET
jgi:hypothetical protein